MHKCEGTNGGCIFLQFVCDGENDCLHGSDESEENCRSEYIDGCEGASMSACVFSTKP